MKPEYSLLFRAALAAATLAALPACQPSQSNQPSGAMPPPEVSVVVAQPRDLPAGFEYVGQIAGVREVEVRPRVSGILERWNYQEGAKVAAGQSLFTIDSAPYRAALARAEAQLASAEASLAQSSRDAVRLKPLFEAKAVSQKDYDDATSSAHVASANVKAAQAAVTEARLNLSYTRVEAPISGITSRALQSEGSLVQAQQSLLTTISQIDPIHVIFSFTETEHLKFTRAMAEGRLLLPKGGQFEVTLKLADGNPASPETAKWTSPTCASIRTPAPSKLGRCCQSPGTAAPRPVRPRGARRAVRPGARDSSARGAGGSEGKMVLVVNEQGIAEPRPVQVGRLVRRGLDRQLAVSPPVTGDRGRRREVLRPVHRSRSPKRLHRRPAPTRQARRQNGIPLTPRPPVKGTSDHAVPFLHRPPHLRGGAVHPSS